MSGYVEGDLVEAVKGETVIRGRLWRDPWTGELAIPGINDPGYIKELTGRLMFTLSLIEKVTR